MKRWISQLVVASVVVLVPTLALAAEGMEAAGSGMGGKGLIALGAGLGIGLASAGGAYGQGRLVSASLEGISRNPAASGQMFVPFILGVAFVESLVLLSFVVTILLQGKV